MTEIGYTPSEFFQMLNEVALYFNPPEPHTQPTKAQERYTAYLSSILDRLIKLQNWKSRQLEKADRPDIDWRDVGDAAHIDDLLAMACEFLEMEPETSHPNHAGVKYAVYLSPKQGEAAMTLGEGDVNAGIRKALDRACLDRQGNFFCTLPAGHPGEHVDTSLQGCASMRWTNTLERVNR